MIAGLKYRFRLINSGVHNCPVDINIDGHTITAIASDGHDIESVEVDSLVSYAGERWDFVIEANRPVGNYWVRFTGLMDCDQRFTIAHQGAPEREPKEPVGYNVHPKPQLVRSKLEGCPQLITLPVLIDNNKSNDPVLLHNPDTSVVLAYDFNKVDHPMYHKPNAYRFNQVNATFRRYTPQFNHISFKMPHSPLLSQYSDVDPRIFCENHNLTDCNTTFCKCLNIIEVPTNSNVEIILINIEKDFPNRILTYNANHPFHLHGFAFRVVGMDRLRESLDVELVNKLNREGRLVRNLENPPFNDTVTVPDGGYTILRFHASNPGK
ncbi:iron assimilation by reduction and transport [Homalodisca vitripennis]|nr:iron assimilation by reduction and transport [Homalodisca vitripennis]